MNKPVAIFRHSATEGPAFFADYLDAQQIPWQLMALDEGAMVPQYAEDFAGLVFMGGPMSANDDLPWIEPVLQLICQAVDKDIPVLGHCLLPITKSSELTLPSAIKSVTFLRPT